MGAGRDARQCRSAGPEANFLRRRRIPIMSTRPFVLGLAGGSGSGKTTITEAIADRLGGDIDTIQHDSYYRHRPDLSYEERTRVNYDHPDSLETTLLVQHLNQLLAGSTADIPEYDFAQHLRRDETRTVEPAPVLVVEGILVLSKDPGNEEDKT